MKNKFSIAMSLAVILAMLLTSLALADEVVPDGDLLTSGNQGTVDLGTVSPGASLSPQVSFILVCSSKQHVDQGQAVHLTASAFSVPTGGSLSASNAAIPSIPAAWPDDTTGGGNTNCPSPAPSPINDNGNSAVSITAPTAPGSYTYVVRYSISLSPAGNNDNLAIQGGEHFDVTYTLTVSTPPPPSDTTDPSFDCTVPDQTIWYGSDVTVNCTASDSGSGLANSSDESFSLSTSVAAGTETASAATGSRQVCDNANNCVTVGPYTFKVDKKAPQQTACDTPDGAWHAGDVTLYCQYSDGGSGPATQSVALSTNVATGTETSNALASAGGAQACDAVSNCATSPADIGGNQVDKKAPTNISFAGGGITAGGSYYFGFVPAGPSGCTATDGGSGLAACNVTGGGTTVGSHSYTATATDNVGNSDTATLSYTVLAWTLNGFYQPVDMPNPNIVWNTVKGGATVPLKFEVFAGSTELTNTNIVSALSKQVACGTAGAEDTVEVVATGGTSMRYDAVAGQFIYNWQTPKLPGKCYSVTLTTQDGSSLVAYFKLK